MTTIAIVRMFGGQQDGLVATHDAVPAVLWVPTIFEQRRHEEMMKKTGDDTIPYDDSETLPYIKFRSFLDDDDNLVCDYEFCEEMLVSHESET